MEITEILIAAAVSLLIGCFVPERWRITVFFVLSLIALFWLQPPLPVDRFIWLFPFATLFLTAAVWWLTRSPENSENWQQIGLLLGLGCGFGMVISRPDASPDWLKLATIGTLGLGTVVGAAVFTRGEIEFRKQAGLVIIFCLVVILFVLKTPALVRFLSQAARFAEGMDTQSASGSDLQWIGISYIAFRLIAVLLDFRNDRLPALSFQEALLYVIFPASLVAGPIDQAQRFTGDLRAQSRLDAERLVDAGRRLTSGVFKKFVIADSLALVALSPRIAQDADTLWGAWLVVYLYAFQIFFDFSGYTDIAIGLGKLVGVDLPENFDRPYLRQNLALFWQSWHMTLTRWFRTYFFIPLTRALLRRKLPISDYLVAQLATMTLIGLWHGVTVNFVLWGVWHAVGLTIHKQIADRTRPWYLRQRQKPWANRLIYGSGVFVTFHYVVLGWVFFALPEPWMSFELFGKLFGQ
ncbi:MAG: MBOAT family protein [Anaerolineae bacterium]|nr:MAG: MBOAT family protein [Anaerolineae bacterium]